MVAKLYEEFSQNRIGVCTALDEVHGSRATTLWKPTFVSLDVNHSTNDTRECDWVVEGHERIESAVCIPLLCVVINKTRSVNWA
jgi:hypothetical protein